MTGRNEMLEQMVARLFADLAAGGARDWDPLGWLPHWSAIAQTGLPDLMRAEEVDGFGGGWVEMGAVCRALGREGLALPVAETILARHWLDRLGLPVTDGIDGFAIAEPLTEGPGDRVTVDLPAVPWGLSAGRVLLIGSGGGWWLLPVDAAEGRPGRNLGGDPRDRLRFVSASALAHGQLPVRPEVIRTQAALMRACQMEGALQRMLSMCVTHANDRSQFGRPIARFQIIQQQLAQLAGEAAAVAAATAGACKAMAAGDGLFHAACAKWRANRAAAAGVDIAIQVHGAIGITREFPLHQFTLRLQAWAGEQGNEQDWARRIGGMVLDRPTGPVWHWLTARDDHAAEGM